MTLLECENLSVGYEKPGVAKDISFTLNKGDYLCILGENGAGKSTLIKTILGLLKPVSGTLKKNFSHKKLGYLPQQTVVQKDFPATVKEIILSGCMSKMNGFFYTKKEKEIALENMKKFNIENLSKRSYKELSGGQQQRVLLARAMCSAEDLLILDEPVSGLDPKVTEELYNFVRTFNQEGLTIMMITHDMSAIKYASHILSLGSEPFFGTQKNFFETPHGKRILGEAK